MSTHHHASAKLDCDTTAAHLKFIELVKRYPILYKGNELILDSQDFRRNQKIINQSWHLIASELGVSVGECKRRWKFLKETFLQIRKRSLSDAGSQNRKKWVYEDALSFLTTSKPDSQQEPQHTMDNIIHIESGSNIQEGTVEFIELDMDSMGDSEYYIMDSSMDEETGEMIKIATPLQPNQIIVNDKTVQKIITICDDSQNLENATFVDVHDFDKNNYIIASPMVEGEEDVEYVFSNGTDGIVGEMENGNEEEEESEIVERTDDKIQSENKTMCLSEEQIERINELLAMPRNEIDVEHFFENMAKVVLRLPRKLQAEVKSQISGIVSTAELNVLKKVK